MIDRKDYNNMDPWKAQDVLDNLWRSFHKSNSNKGQVNMFDWEELQEIFLISDTHFWHDNIIKYCNRPKDWQDTVIKNWNSVVNKEDTVLHLGDFSLANKEKTKDIVSILNGTIYMIGGNHDRHGKKWFKDVGINKIGPFVVQGEGNDILYFTHRPMRENIEGYNIHGHWHNDSPLIWEGHNSNHINVSVEQIHYMPRKFKNLWPLLKKGGLHYREELI